MRRVVSVEALQGSRPVYDLQIAQTQNFVAGGICVHNCQNPNLQNVPKHSEKLVSGIKYKVYGPEIRHAFVAAPGWTLMEADFSQLELRVAAWYSEDPLMIKAYEDGVDVHKVVASKIFDVPIEQVHPEQRFVAKFVDFGIVYGRQAQSLAAEELKAITGGSVKKAQKFIDDFLAGFPTLATWRQSVIDHALREGYVESYHGRRRRWPLITNQNRGEVEREAVNAPIQGLASDINLLGLARVQRELARSDRLQILWPIHDSGVYHIKDEYLDELVPQVIAIMEDAPLVPKKLPFKVDYKLGKVWGEFYED
jgi:DNA polymerase-1